MRVRFYGNELLSFLLKQIVEIEVIEQNELELGNEEYFLITDDNIFKTKGIDLSGYKKIFILSDKIETGFFQENMTNHKIVYLKKEEYIDIVDIFSKEKEILNPESKVILSDVGSEVYIPLKEISYFSYDRNQKKSFVMIGGEKKYLRKSLMELEEILPKKIFERVERGIILNMSMIKEIDYREEFVLMQDNERIYLGKTILKKIKDLTNQDYQIL